LRLEGDYFVAGGGHTSVVQVDYTQAVEDIQHDPHLVLVCNAHAFTHTMQAEHQHLSNARRPWTSSRTGKRQRGVAGQIQLLQSAPHGRAQRE